MQVCNNYLALYYHFLHFTNMWMSHAIDHTCMYTCGTFQAWNSVKSYFVCMQHVQWLTLNYNTYCYSYSYVHYSSVLSTTVVLWYEALIITSSLQEQASEKMKLLLLTFVSEDLVVSSIRAASPERIIPTINGTVKTTSTDTIPITTKISFQSWIDYKK